MQIYSIIRRVTCKVHKLFFHPLQLKLNCPVVQCPLEATEKWRTCCLTLNYSTFTSVRSFLFLSTIAYFDNLVALFTLRPNFGFKSWLTLYLPNELEQLSCLNIIIDK